MGTITDAAGNEVSVDELFGFEIIRCRNWEEEREICHPDCGIEVPVMALRSAAWMELVLEQGPEWFIMFRSCSVPEHRRHFDPYCSITCFERYHARHEHPHHPEAQP